MFRKVTSCGLLRRASGPVPLDASGYPGRLSDEPRMKDLLTFAVEAHGGLERWGRLETLSAELTVGGAIWEVKKQPGLLTNKVFEITTHEERVTITPFATVRRIYAYDAQRKKVPEPLLVALDFGKLTFR